MMVQRFYNGMPVTTGSNDSSNVVYKDTTVESALDEINSVSEGEFYNGTHMYAKGHYYKYGHIVTIQYFADIVGLTSDGVILGTLPIEYRPPQPMAIVNDNIQYKIETSGEIIAYSADSSVKAGRLAMTYITK